MNVITFQEMLKRLANFWELQGCVRHQGYDLETGAGTFNPTTFLRCLGPEPYKAVYFEPCRRPSDGRYGTNPNRVQHYFQGQVIMKPSPPDILDLCLKSLEAIGFNLSEHDMRFVHDDWESPTVGAWGLGWEVWMDGMEVAQFTYFQCLGGVSLKPVSAEITYGLERLALYLQKVDSIFDLKYNDELNYGDIYFNNEVQWSHYNFEKASTAMWFRHFDDFEQEAKQLIQAKFPIPAYDFVIKASHAFNLLDARGVISVTERTGYIGRIRELARQIAESYIASREELGYPLLNRFKDEKFKHALPQLVKWAPELLSKDISGHADFVLEIGSEELPATFVPIGIKNLEKAFKTFLDKEGIAYEGIQADGTPRRLVVWVKGLSLVKPATSTEKRGPSVEQVFGKDGVVTPSGEGFFRSVNKTPLSLEAILRKEDCDIVIRAVKGVDYLVATKHVAGRPTAEILAEQLPNLILNLDFPKKMRWGDLSITYARPLRWLLALFGKHVVPFGVGDLSSDRLSWGHRQLANHSFSISQAGDFVTDLLDHHVMVKMEERRNRICSQLDALESTLGGSIIARDKVLPQVVNLVEWPEVMGAAFDSSFLRIPKEVLISEMVEHQKYFPVANNDGMLINQFVITANTTPSDEIAQGNQKVLSARLSDGVFLYEQGIRIPLQAYNEKLESVTFQKELGTVYDKVERLQRHVNYLQRTLKISTQEKARRAANLSKADLASEMVHEFPELQGVIGRYYAADQGEDEEVAMAIEEQWMPRKEGASLPSTETGMLLSLADKFDNIVGCFVANLKPTSSSDPYALRRQAFGIVKMLINAKAHLPLSESLSVCFDHFLMAQNKEKHQLIEEIETFFSNRVKTVFMDDGFLKDEIEAALSFGFDDIYDAFCKVQALHHFRKDLKFSLLWEVYKRAKGQLEGQEVQTFSPDLLKEDAEKNLHTELSQSNTLFTNAIAGRDYDAAYQLISELQAPLAILFEQVKIMDEDLALRANRLALLQHVFERFSKLLDFNKIQISKLES
ncbi:MAG: glycine--tRNA ligase [Parachlamydiaceae bacterium]|nr:glycine--tRNA ligase [Parachlamydiaceae bacterium]